MPRCYCHDNTTCCVLVCCVVYVQIRGKTIRHKRVVKRFHMFVHRRPSCVVTIYSISNTLFCDDFDYYFFFFPKKMTGQLKMILNWNVIWETKNKSWIYAQYMHAVNIHSNNYLCPIYCTVYRRDLTSWFISSVFRINLFFCIFCFFFISFTFFSIYCCVYWVCVSLLMLAMSPAMSISFPE